MEKQEFKLKRVNVSMDTKALSLSMVTDSSAAGCATVTNWYARTLATETDINAFNNVPFNKDRKRIPELRPATHLLAPFTCSWADKTVNLTAKTVEVAKLSAMYQVCISDIEDSFMVDFMRKGSNNTPNPQEFIDYTWDTLGRYVKAEIEQIRWNGDTTAAPGTLNALTNGYLTLLAINAAGPADVTEVNAAGSITASNVIDEIGNVIAALPLNVRSNPEALSIFVSSDVFLAYSIAAAKGNTIMNITGDMGNMFLGKYKLIEVSQLPAKTIIAGPTQDFVYTYDIPGEKEQFIVADLTYSMAEPVLRFRVNVYVGFDIYDYNNIVWYH